MSTEIKLPELGEGIDSGDVLNVLVNVGDTVAAEDSLLEIETDKATVEVPAPQGGTIEKVVVNAGDTVNVGQLIMVFAGAGDTPAPAAEATQEPATAPEPTPAAAAEVSTSTQAPSASGSTGPVTVNLPELGEGIESGDILNVLVSVGDSIAEEDSILEVETDKATVEVPSPTAGTVKSIAVKAGDSISVGQPVLELVGSAGSAPAAPEPAKASTTNIPAAASAPASAPKPSATPTPGGSGFVDIGGMKLAPAAPHVRKFAYEIGIDITSVPPGDNGRITVDDVKAHAKAVNTGKAAGGASGSVRASKPLPDFSKFGPIRREKMAKIRQVTASHMDHCWNTIPHVTQFEKADITDLEATRKLHKDKVKEEGGSLTITAILLKALGMTLREFPNFNAAIDTDNNEIIYKDFFNVGVAVDTPNGLLVPVIRDVDKKSIFELSQELGVMAKKARDRKIKPDELQGGSITITNLGGMGGTYFTPIVNWPESSILGVSKSAMEPVWNGSEFVPRLMMPMSLSYDHRLIDGADGIRFVNHLVDLLQKPFALAIYG